MPSASDTAPTSEPVQTPELDSVEMTMSLGSRSERLSDREYLLLQQLIAFREQQLSGDSLKDTIGVEPSAPDRIIESAMVKLISKTNALFPTFPLIRRISRNAWIYTEVAPKRRKR